MAALLMKVSVVKRSRRPGGVSREISIVREVRFVMRRVETVDGKEVKFENVGGLGTATV
jgi:hypothetical protein